MNADRRAEVALKVTFVITTRNNAATIAACVRSCVEQVGVEVEVIVVDNHSDDGTADAARQAGAERVVLAGPERSAQRNLGVESASAAIVAIIDSDMTASPKLAAELVAAFLRNDRLGAVVIPEFAAGRGCWQEARKLEKRLYLGDPRVEAARAFRTAAFAQVGGYDEDLVGAEDWDLPDRVFEAGWQLGRVGAHLQHHETVAGVRDLFRKKRYYGYGVAEYRRRAGGRARPILRWSLISRPVMLLRRPRATVGLFVLKVVEATGIAAGMLDHARAARP